MSDWQVKRMESVQIVIRLYMPDLKPTYEKVKQTLNYLGKVRAGWVVGQKLKPVSRYFIRI